MCIRDRPHPGEIEYQPVAVRFVERPQKRLAELVAGRHVDLTGHDEDRDPVGVADPVDP